MESLLRRVDFIFWLFDGENQVKSFHRVRDMGCLPFLKLVPLLVLSSGIYLS